MITEATSTVAEISAAAATSDAAAANVVRFLLTMEAF